MVCFFYLAFGIFYVDVRLLSTAQHWMVVSLTSLIDFVELKSILVGVCYGW